MRNLVRSLALLLVGAPLLAFGAAPSLDGVSATNSSTNTVVLTITTSAAPDVVVIESTFSLSMSSTPATISTVTGGGLTWARRGTACTVTGTGAERSMEEWYAIASTTLSSAAITVTYSTSASGYSEKATIFALKNANTTTPFDPNASLPGCASGTAVNTLSYTTSTNSGNDFVVASSGYSAATISCPAGFTALGTGSSTFTCFAYETPASPLSSVSISSSTSGTSAASTLFIDAIQPAAGSTCTHTGWTIPGGDETVPTSGSTTVYLKSGDKGTVDCSTTQYYQPGNSGAFGAN